MMMWWWWWWEFCTGWIFEGCVGGLCERYWMNVQSRTARGSTAAPHRCSLVEITHDISSHVDPRIAMYRLAFTAILLQ